MAIILCRMRSLPLERLEEASRRAIEMNPANASVSRQMFLPSRRGGPRRLAVVKGKKWPRTGVKLSVSFLDNASVPLRKRIIAHMNAWSASANVSFAETQGVGEVRISRLDEGDDAGYWSYVGTDILSADADQPTMNLDGFTMKVSEGEFRRVVRHETGHTLGFEHEHLRSDIVAKIVREKAFKYFKRTEKWTRKEVLEQVLTPLSKRSLLGTEETDPLSIMCYQLPGSIMKDRKPIVGGDDINERDFAFAAMVYPKATPAKAPVGRSAHIAEPLAGGESSDERDTFHLVIMDGPLPPLPSSVERERREQRFARVFASYGGARVTHELRLRAAKDEPPTSFGRIIGVHERILKYTGRLSGTLPQDSDLVEFGTLLFDTLFQGDVRRLYDEARSRERKHKLDLVFTSMIPWIAEKPWEFAYDRGRESFLATEDVHFVRNVLTNIPSDRIAKRPGPIRILVVAAQPIGYEPLSVEQEEAVVRRGFDPLVAVGAVAIEVIARVTPARLHDAVSRSEWDVVHFIGHGEYDEKKEEGCLLFEDEHGGEIRLGERSTREILTGRGLSLVFLNACESGRGGRGRAEFNKGTAQSLVAHGLPAVVANQYSVLDSSATSFAQYFYWSLAQGMSFGESAREARVAVNYSLQGEVIDWAIPVVYARDANEALCPPAVVRSAFPTARVSGRQARGGRRGVERIAVWDIDGTLPELDETIAVMNAAQSVFEFALVDMSVPLDVWDLQTTAGTPYLWAEHAARRLQSKPTSLGVEILVCITRQWMRNDDTFNLFAWWPDSQQPRIIFFSIAGFDGLEAAGTKTHRAVANALVTGLAGFHGNYDSHEAGPTSCPMYYNRKRDEALITGKQHFDAKCTRALRDRLGNRFDALEALLRTFDNESSSGRG
jgi:hypothetical protein